MTTADQTPAGADIVPAGPAPDELRTTLTELADAWDGSARAYLSLRDHHHDRGDETTARISRVRADMCTRHAAQLRQLLEEK